MKRIAFLRVAVATVAGVAASMASAQDKSIRAFHINIPEEQLVVHHEDYDRYKRFSVRRALVRVNRQLTLICSRFRRVSQAATVQRTAAWLGRRRSKPCVDNTANSISAILSQLPCFGV